MHLAKSQARDCRKLSTPPYQCYEACCKFIRHIRFRSLRTTKGAWGRGGNCQPIQRRGRWLVRDELEGGRQPAIVSEDLDIALAATFINDNVFILHLFCTPNHINYIPFASCFPEFNTIQRAWRRLRVYVVEHK